MIREWLRIIVSTAIIVLGPIVLFDAVIALAVWYFRIPSYTFLAPGLTRFRLGYLMLCSGAYGFGRVSRVHPIFNTAYRRWLMTTPWRRGLPLPLGEVSPTMADALRLGALVAIAALYLRVAPWLPLVPFLAVYIAMLTIALARSGEREIPAILWGGMMVAIVLFPDWLAVLMVLVALLPLAWWSWWKSQVRFPWGLEDKPDFAGDVGGFWSRIGPRKPPAPISLIRSVTLSFLIALTLYALLGHGEIGRSDLLGGGGFLCVVVALLLALVRFFIYCGTYVAPITSWGRLWTGRWIIPGYDYVLLAPVAMCLIGAVSPFMLLASGLPPDACMALAAFPVILIGLAAPPTRYHWHLTGSHRISLLGEQMEKKSVAVPT